MATEMKGSSWDDYGKKRTKARIRYPWHLWLNGSMWYLVHGEDIDKDMELVQFQRYVYTYASIHGVKVKTKLDEWNSGIYIKAYANTSRTGLRRSRHFRSIQRRIEEMIAHDKYEYDYPEIMKDLQEKAQEEGIEWDPHTARDETSR